MEEKHKWIEDKMKENESYVDKAVRDVEFSLSYKRTFLYKLDGFIRQKNIYIFL